MPTSLKISKRTRRVNINPSLSCDAPFKEAGTVTVQGIPYRLVMGAEMEVRNLKTKKIQCVRGAMNPFHQIIGLDTCLNIEQREVTLLHEVVHAVDDALDIGLEEDQVGRLAAGLYSVTYKGPRKRDKTRTIRGVFYG